MGHGLAYNPGICITGVKRPLLDYMTRDSVAQKIKKTFGTYSEFCRKAKINRYEFQRDFLQARNVSKEDVSEINGIVASLSDQGLTLPEIRSKLKSLRKALKEFGGVPAFCKANPEFKQGTVNGAIYGRSGYAKYAEKLIKHFGL